MSIHQEIHDDIASNTWQVIRDLTGYYRAMSNEYRPQLDDFGETSVARDMTYNEASQLAEKLYDVEQVMES